MEKQVKVINKHVGGGGGAVYGLGVIGALFYFLQHSATASETIIGIIKAFFWPAFIVFRLLEFLHV